MLSYAKPLKMGEMPMARKLLFLLFTAVTFMTYAEVTNFPTLLFDNDNHFFIDSGYTSDNSGPQFAFIIPKDEYLLNYTQGKQPYCDNRHMSILENIAPAVDHQNSRYHLDNGFVFFRTSSDGIQGNYASDEKIVDDIIDILNREGNGFEVYFYDYKNNFVFFNEKDVSCSGAIFSSKNLNKQGYFFMRKLKPKASCHSCYLIYYDYTANGDVARIKFENLFNCIHLISEGCIKKYSSQ